MCKQADGRVCKSAVISQHACRHMALDLSEPKNRHHSSHIYSFEVVKPSYALSKLDKFQSMNLVMISSWCSQVKFIFMSCSCH